MDGVCRYDERSVVCWDGAGKDSERLAAEVKSALSGYPGGPHLPVVYGQKSRLAVALVPSSRADRAPVWSVDAEPTSAASIDLGLPRARDGRARSLVVMMGSARTVEGALRFTQRTRLPAEISIDLKPGSSAKLEGTALTVSKVEKLSAADEDRFFVRNRPAWRVVIVQRGTSNRHLEFFPVDPYPAVMADGRRSSIDSSSHGKIAYAPKDAPAIRSIYYSELPEGAVAVLLYGDPAKVKRLTLGGSEVRTISMSGVPLDPK